MRSAHRLTQRKLNEMADTSRPPVAVPWNGKGTLAGVAASIATAYLAKTGIYASAASWLASSGLSPIAATILTAVGIPVASTQPEVILAAAISVGVGALVNYGVTHYGGIRKVKEFYEALPSTYAEYPNATKSGTSTTNLSTKDGLSVNQKAGK